MAKANKERVLIQQLIEMIPATKDAQSWQEVQDILEAGLGSVSMNVLRAMSLLTILSLCTLGDLFALISILDKLAHDKTPKKTK